MFYKNLKKSVLFETFCFTSKSFKIFVLMSDFQSFPDTSIEAVREYVKNKRNLDKEIYY